MLILPWTLPPWVETGAPLSPIPLEIGGLVLGRADPAFAWGRAWDVSGAWTWPVGQRALLAAFRPPGVPHAGIGLLYLLPLLLAPVGIASAWRRRPVAITMLASVAVLGIVFLHMPPMDVSRVRWPDASARFIAVSVLVAIPLALLCTQRWPRFGRAVVQLFFVIAAYHAITYARYGWSPWDGLYVASLAIALLALGGVVAAARQRTPRGAWLAAAAGVVAILVATARFHMATCLDQLGTATHHHPFPRDWRLAAALVDEPGRAHRIAVTAGTEQAGDNWFAYFFLGRELQNSLHYLPVTSDGSIAHFGPKGERADAANVNAWLARVAQRRITHVVSLSPRSIELGWMETRPGRFEWLEGWGLFRVRPGPDYGRGGSR